MANMLSFKQSELTLFRGTDPKGGKILILVAGNQMALSTDFGDDDPWVLKDDVIEVSYNYEPLNLSKYTDLEKVW